MKPYFLVLVLLVLLVGIVTAADPYAGFIPSNISGAEPLVINFTDISYNSPTAWAWSFRDVTGNNTPTEFSTLQNPQYSFVKGNYSIWLNASNEYGYNLTPLGVFVNVSGLTAAFSGYPVVGSSPTSVTFTDLSTNTPTAWNWYWYANETLSSSSHNPTQSFTTGIYNVRLNASNAYRYDWENKTGYLNITAPPHLPVTDFTSNVTSGVAPKAVKFTDLTTYAPTTWTWNFGDAGFSYLQNPTHTYTTAGLYAVSLSACNVAGCNNKTGYMINITAAGVAPTTDFTATPTSGLNPLTVTFTDLSTGVPTSWLWELTPTGRPEVGWTTFSTAQNPTVSFGYINNLGLSPGVHNIQLTTHNAYGAGYKFKGSYIVVYSGATPTPTPTPTTPVPTVTTYSPSGGSSPHMREMAVTPLATVPIGRLNNITEALFGGWNETNQTPQWEPVITNSVAVYTDFLGPVAFLLIFLLPFGMMWLAHGNMKLLSILGIIVGLFVNAYLPANYAAAAIICIVVAAATLVWSLFRP